MTFSENGSHDLAALHQRLVDQLKRNRCIRSAGVEAAFRAVPRHLFLPDVAPEKVYRDEAIPTKQIDGVAVSSSSQPAIMAIMLEQLGLEPGQRVLEIGAGTGYNAALMAHIVGASGQVVTVDIDEEIAARARRNLAAAGFDRVQVVCGDGGFGYQSGALYDRIILTVGADDIVPAWHEQLTPDGRIVLPLSLGGPQVAVAFERAGDHWTSTSVQGCGFMRLRGAFAADGPQTIPLGPEPGLTLTVGADLQVDADALYRLLAGPWTDRPAGVRVSPGEVGSGLNLWLALSEPGGCTLTAVGALAERGIVPRLFGQSGEWKSCATLGLVGEGAIALLAPPSDRNSFSRDGSRSSSFPLFVRSFGTEQALASHLVERIAQWDAAGRPSTVGLRIRVYPPATEYSPAAGEFVLRRPWSQLVLDWPEAGWRPSAASN